jgi:hypothetical protein
MLGYSGGIWTVIRVHGQDSIVINDSVVSDYASSSCGGKRNSLYIPEYAGSLGMGAARVGHQDGIPEERDPGV